MRVGSGERERGPVGIVVLAAGASTRLGEPKQLLELDGTPLLRHAVQTALGSRCRPIVVVLGAHARRARRVLEGLPVEVVVNRHWRRGQSQSIRAGLRALEAAPERVRAAVILPCDQPRVTRALLDELVAHYLASDKPIVACAYAGIVGAPALFDRSLFPELERLRGDRGARGILERRPEDVASVPFPDAAFDVDRPADAAALRRDRSKEIE